MIPTELLFDQTVRVLPRLQQVFADIAVFANAATAPHSIEYLRQRGVRVKAEAVEEGFSVIGKFRRAAVEFALQGPCPFMLYCDFDRILHWMEYPSARVDHVAQQISAHDFTILGRTPRAFATHPRIQRDTEAIINHVFERVSDRAWDTGAGARGLSRRAAEAIVTRCLDDQSATMSRGRSALQQLGGFSLGYLETEGLEFETPDRFPAEVARRAAWRSGASNSTMIRSIGPTRLELARIEVAAMLPFVRR